jgi:hypothetical protein
VPPEPVIGRSVETKVEVRDGVPVLVRQAKAAFIVAAVSGGRFRCAPAATRQSGQASATAWRECRR